jgi:hypothetical protein
LKPWDMYRGKRRCPTCGVPSLICRECWTNDKNNVRKIDKTIRCDLCVEQNIYSKKKLNDMVRRNIQRYQSKLICNDESTQSNNSPTKDDEQANDTRTRTGIASAGNAKKLSSKNATTHTTANNSNKNDVAELATGTTPPPPQCTRLYIKNMCRKHMTEDVLLDTFPGITHIVWRTDRSTNMFLGSAWVEMISTDAAASAVQRSGEYIFGRPIYVDYQPADAKDLWPPAKHAVRARIPTTATKSYVTPDDDTTTTTTTGAATDTPHVAPVKQQRNKYPPPKKNHHSHLKSAGIPTNGKHHIKF